MTEFQKPNIMFRELATPEGNQTYLDVTNVTVGLLHDVIKLLGKELNFTFTLFKRTDSQWGAEIPTGSGKWSGMVGDVLAGSLM